MQIHKTESITIDQAKQTILQTMQLYFAKDRNGNYRFDRRRARPLCLMGPAGIGKTEIVRQAAEERGVAFLSYAVTHHTRQSLIGLPKLNEREIAGKSVFVTEYTMSEIIAEIHRVMAQTGKQEGILFLDEFNCISESLYPVMLQVMQDKTLGPHPIPEGWMLVLAGNTTEYHQCTMEMDAVTADRVRMLWIEPDFAVWKEYMEPRGGHPVVLSYLRTHKEHFYLKRVGFWKKGLITPRAWEDLSAMLCRMEKKGFSVDLSVIGQYLHDAEVARSFFSYYRQYETLFASGLVEGILNGNDAAGKNLSQKPFAEQWSLISAVLDELRVMAEERLESQQTARKQFEQKLRNSLALFLENLQTDAQLQYLFHELSADGSIIKEALFCDVPEMKELFSRISCSFADETEQILQELWEEKKELRKKRKKQNKAG